MNFLIITLSVACIVINKIETKCSKKAYSPVCGSDKWLYNNICQLESASVTIVHWSKCSCYFDCTDDYSPVCGNDGNVYKNRCILLERSCSECGAIFETDDPAESCKKRECSKVAFSPVCAEGGEVYANTCEVGIKQLGIVDWNNCSPCSASIPKILDPVLDPVWDTDGKQYSNRKDLLNASCRSQGKIKERVKK